MKRLGKQRVEALQIYQVITAPKSKGWANHPAVNMWRGHLWWLVYYAIEICVEWKKRGYKDTLLPRFLDFIDSIPVDEYPTWLGKEELHSSHRANLIRKDEAFYRSQGWTESPQMGYYWPTK